MLVEEKNVAKLEQLSKLIVEQYHQLDKSQQNRVYSVVEFLAGKFFGPASEFDDEVEDVEEVDISTEE